MLRFSKLQQTLLRQKTAPFYLQQKLARQYFHLSPSFIQHPK